VIDVVHADCIDAMAAMPAASVDAIVTDPPYGLGFMGKAWDHGVPGAPFWQAALRVAKPGAHLVAFGGTRTFHRLACAIEDAGWEIRDCLCWLYGTGFPKSLDVSKAIDAHETLGASNSRAIREARDARDVVGTKIGMPGKSAGQRPRGGGGFPLGIGEDPDVRRARVGKSLAAGGHRRDLDITAPTTDLARQWEGWGTALKPAFEPIILARKPLVGTVAQNVAEYGTGGINVDGCRIAGGKRSPEFRETLSVIDRSGKLESRKSPRANVDVTQGRWPANVCLDETAAAALDEQSGTSRFFYCAKASKSERGASNTHPTVKPLALMRWLVRLVTPAGGLVLDPFAGSGTTGLAARAEGMRAVLVEREAEHVDIIRARLESVVTEIETTEAPPPTESEPAPEPVAHVAPVLPIRAPAPPKRRQQRAAARQVAFSW
jgi:DNA modification methylase